MYVPQIVAIVESLVGSVDRATDSVNVNRISVLYTRLVESLQTLDVVNFDFATQVCSCTYIHTCMCTYKYIHSYKLLLCDQTRQNSSRTQ